MELCCIFFICLFAPYCLLFMLPHFLICLLTWLCAGHWSFKTVCIDYLKCKMIISFFGEESFLLLSNTSRQYYSEMVGDSGTLGSPLSNLMLSMSPYKGLSNPSLTLSKSTVFKVLAHKEVYTQGHSSLMKFDFYTLFLIFWHCEKWHLASLLPSQYW